MAGIGLRGMRLRELVYADDICLLATSPAKLQALIDALAIYFGTLHMEISVPKTKVMSFFAEGAPITAFTCNGLPGEQIDSFKYVCLHFHKFGDTVHLIEPIKHKAVGSWAAVQRHLSLLQCGYTFNAHLQLLQSILVPVLHYVCEVWGMHSPDTGSAKWARLDLQKVYGLYLRVVCGLSSSTLCSMWLTEVGVLPLQVFWWRRTLPPRKNVAALPVGSFFHTILLDRLYDAFHHGTFYFTSSVAACLHHIGVSMPRDTDRVPMLDTSAVIDALNADL